MIYRLGLITCLLALFVAIANAQPAAQTQKEQKPKPTVSKDQALKGANVEEADPNAEQRRTTAVALLTALADDARSFKDQSVRARIMARAADALWTTEQDRARDYFRRAWEAAESGDAETARRAAEEAQRQFKQNGTVVRRTGRDMRLEVLRLVAKRDKPLADEFLKKLEDDAEKKAKETATENDLARITNQWNAPEAKAKRLALARALLQDGDVTRAVQFALPVLGQVNKDSINFLSALRQKDAQKADSIFAGLLNQTAVDPMSDANTVSGLSSYAFTPFLYVNFSKDGGSFISAEGPPAGPVGLSPELLRGFFQSAMSVLMRPLPPPEQDTTSAGRTGKYMIMKRLLPLFEQNVPQQANELRVAMNALATQSDAAGADGNRALDRGINDSSDTGNPVKNLQDRIDRAKTSTERDGIYADVAAALGGNGDMQARELANKIEDADFRKQTLAYVDFELLRSLVQKKDAPEILKLARTGEVTRIQRIWGYAQAARLLTDQARVADLLQEAATEARRMEATDQDRPRALIAVANGFSRLDVTRAWELMTEAIKSANSVDTFTGEDGQIGAMLRGRNFAVATAAGTTEFNVGEAFASLATDDFYRSVELAKTFAGDTPRANATIAIARAILEPRQRSGAPQ